MTGDAPQPGETPRDADTPWSRADPVSPWWSADDQAPAAGRTGDLTRAADPATPTLTAPQPAQHTGDAAAAQRAGDEDVRAALTGEPAASTEVVALVPEHPPAPAAEGQRGPRHAQPSRSRPVEQLDAVENDHARVDAERFNTAGAGTVYAAGSGARPAGEAGPETTIIDALNAVPLESPPAGAGSDGMVPPEPELNRPTVALDRSDPPGQSPTGLSRQSRARRDTARADRALQDRVRQERTAALLETSPFWKAEEERRATAALPPGNPGRLGTAGRPPRRRAPEPRRPAAGLLALLALGLVAAFFAWVSAEPFWLAVGHGDRGSATVARCTGAGVTQRCTGQFTAADNAYQVDGLALFGVESAQRAPGVSVPARMVSSESRQAYVGGPGLLMHLRWLLSFVLVLLSGVGIAGLTGAGQLDSAPARRGALLLSLAAPLVLLAGFLTSAY